MLSRIAVEKKQQRRAGRAARCVPLRGQEDPFDGQPPRPAHAITYVCAGDDDGGKPPILVLEILRFTLVHVGPKGTYLITAETARREREG